MKFLHCSDLHLGKKPYFGSEEFKNKRFEDYFSGFNHKLFFFSGYLRLW